MRLGRQGKKTERAVYFRLENSGNARNNILLNNFVAK